MDNATFSVTPVKLRIIVPPFYCIGQDTIKFEAERFSTEAMGNWIGSQNSQSKLLFKPEQDPQGLKRILTSVILPFSH